MNKLLLLALLGLVLGGGVWKAQHPDGTLEDLKADSISTFDRLKSGVDAGVGTILSYPQVAKNENGVDERLSDLEEQLDSVNDDSPGSNEVMLQQGAIKENLASLTEQHDDLADQVENLASTVTAGSANGGENNSGITNAELTPVSETDLVSLSESIDSRLAEIENRLDSNNTDVQLIESLNEKLSAAETRLTELEERSSLAAQAQEDTATAENSSESDGESLSIAYTQAQIREQLARAEDQLDNPDQLSDTSELVGLLNDNKSRLDTLEPMIQELPASSARAAYAVQNQSQLQTQVTELQERLASLSSTDTNAVDELTAQNSSDAIEYKIYFDRNSAEITADAAAVLNSFLVQEQNRTTGVSIFGFTDRRGAAEYNQQLALNRASNVRTYLINNGLDIDLIKNINSSGEDAVINSIPDETPDAEQRVVVLLAAQPNQP